MKNRGLFVRHTMFAACIMIGAGLLWGQTGTPTTAAKTPGKTNIALINLKNASGVTAGDAELISDRLRGELFNTGKVNVMEREQMQEILKEQGFQQSGACTNEACMVEIGQLLGVEQLVTGSLGKVGSMFLVNMRIIDVKTAKIMKVVSEDIKGDIEEVVGRLPGIASQLVGSVAGVQKENPETLEKKEEPKKQVEKPEVTEPKEEKKVEVGDERAEKNKNRFGIRLGMGLTAAVMNKKLHYTYTDSSYYSADTILNYANQENVVITRNPLLNYNINFMVKAGPVITIDVGFGYSSNETEYKWLLSGNRQIHDLSQFSFPYVGVNFVKRWYPIKLNVGIFGAFDVLTYEVKYYHTDYGAYVFDTSQTFFSFNGNFGARTGIEFMIGKHVGINLDFIYCYSTYETMKETVEKDDPYSGMMIWRDERTWEITLPMFLFGYGLNFYF